MSHPDARGRLTGGAVLGTFEVSLVTKSELTLPEGDPALSGNNCCRNIVSVRRYL